MSDQGSTAEFEVHAILYRERPDSDVLLPGTRGSLRLSEVGLTWTPHGFGGHRKQPLIFEWADIFRAGFRVTVRSLSHLIELRTSKGVWWLSVASRDETAVREYMSRYVETVEERLI